MNDALLNQIANEDVKTYIKKVDDDSIACIFTDVPYKCSQGGGNVDNKGYGGKNKENKELVKNGKLFKHNDIEPHEYLSDFYRVLEETGHIYLMTNSIHLASIQKEMEKVGFIINNILVMIKDNTVVNQHYMKNCEFTIFARKGGSKGLKNYGINTALNVKMPKKEDKIHDTEKPKDYIKKLVENSTHEGDIVADFFSGSAVVANVAMEIGIDFIGCEIDEGLWQKGQDRLGRAKGNVGLFEGIHDE